MTDGGAMPPVQPQAAARLGHVSKLFGATLALDDVSFDIGQGRIHALMGGNGSGKSTLIKILAGVQPADAGGTIEVAGRVVAADSMNPALAQSLGLRFVHQNPAVFHDLTVAENLAIGHGYPTGPLRNVRWSELRSRAEALLARYQVHATPDTLLSSLRPADRTMVAITRALQDRDQVDHAILVLDEPTAALPDSEVQLLMESIRRLSASGQTVLYVSHRLDEVLAIADDVTVLRDGRHVVTRVAEGLDEPQLIELIVGRSVDTMFPATSAASEGDAALQVRNLSGGPLIDVSFDLRHGEVLGVAGLLGSGRTELLMTIFGALPRTGGEIIVEGTAVSFGHPAEAIAAGLALVPEDRPGQAAFTDMSVAHNFSAASVARYFRFPTMRAARERADTLTAIDRFRIRAGGELMPLSTLSGGNQQKVIVGRWLATAPRILLLDEPTQGVDVGARADIYAFIRDVVEQGVSVLLVSSDFDELVRVADRVVVLTEGRISAELRPPELTVARCTELAYQVGAMA